MKLHDDELRELLAQSAALGERPPRSARGCPTPEALQRVALAEASRRERVEVVEHVEGCPECAAELRVALLLREPALEAGAAAGSRAPAPSRRPWLVAAGWRLAPAWAVAALLVLSVALGAWALVERRAAARAAAELAVLRQPQVNAQIVDLDPQGALRGGAEPSALEIPGGGAVTLILGTAGGERGCATYDLELVSSDRGVLWRGAGLEKTRYGTFTVAVPAGLLRTGGYQLKLYGRCPRDRELLETYAWRVTRP